VPEKFSLPMFRALGYGAAIMPGEAFIAFACRALRNRFRRPEERAPLTKSPALTRESTAGKSAITTFRIHVLRRLFLVSGLECASSQKT